jgi:NACalpha-BTF3-like transcription factor
VQQAGVAEEKAREAIARNGGDLAKTIMELKEQQ